MEMHKGSKKVKGKKKSLIFSLFVGRLDL